MAKEITYVLPVANTADEQVFGGFPGRWMPGVPVAASKLGLDPDEADRLIAELGLPIQRVKDKT